MRKPDDWPKLYRLAWLIPWRRHAIRRLARRWRRLDNYEWAAT